MLSPWSLISGSLMVLMADVIGTDIKSAFTSNEIIHTLWNNGKIGTRASRHSWSLVKGVSDRLLTQGHVVVAIIMIVFKVFDGLFYPLVLDVLSSHSQHNICQQSWLTFANEQKTVAKASATSPWHNSANRHGYNI